MNETALRRLSMNDIKDLLAAGDKAKDDARKAEIRARHQAIYDQEPEWRGMNICLVRYIDFCGNMGSEAYVDDIFGDFTYGRIEGVVWREKGEIIRIYGGSIDLGIEPEIVRAGEDAYYYLIETSSGGLDLRAAEGMLVR